MNAMKKRTSEPASAMQTFDITIIISIINTHSQRAVITKTHSMNLIFCFEIRLRFHKNHQPHTHRKRQRERKYFSHFCVAPDLEQCCTLIKRCAMHFTWGSRKICGEKNDIGSGIGIEMAFGTGTVHIEHWTLHIVHCARNIVANASVFHHPSVSYFTG